MNSRRQLSSSKPALTALALAGLAGCARTTAPARRTPPGAGAQLADALRGVGQARGISNALKVTGLPKVGHEFASCNRNGELVERVTNFFDRHR